MAKSTKGAGWWTAGMAVALVVVSFGAVVEYRKRTTIERSLATAILTRLDAESERDFAQQELATLRTTHSDQQKEMDRIVHRLQAEARSVEYLQRRLSQAEHQIGQLQSELVLSLREREELSARVGKDEKGPVELEKIVVSTLDPEEMTGKVLQVDKEWNFLVVNLGWDVVSVGDTLGVFQGGELVAKARIERVQEEVAAATILQGYEDNTIKIDDWVAQL